jgi:hypothetical protein
MQEKMSRLKKYLSRTDRDNVFVPDVDVPLRVCLATGRYKIGTLPPVPTAALSVPSEGRTVQRRTFGVAALMR